MVKYYLDFRGHGKYKHPIVKPATKKVEKELNEDELFDSRPEAFKKALELKGKK